uniref:Putative HD superfamily hydrolase n=1 Tax=uncultured bacterium contig00021 TaxID=1181511 RepID=A0A806KHQ7_9BACT|nr:putative HD superfamily hydrolase [uncultured bacterium contig00021]
MKFIRFNAESPSLFADEIKDFVSQKKKTKQYMHLVRYIFKDVLASGDDDPVFTLLDYLEKETDFYTAPASTKFHGSEAGGLVRHSLLVVAYGIELAPVMLSGEVDMYYLVVSCLLHDFCKVNMYETKMRNTKNEKTGNWEKTPYYRVRDDYLSYGHGIESMLRLNRFIEMPDSWNQAIRWHMGAYDITQTDKFALEKSLAAFREVLLLQTADMLAGLVDET